MNFPSRLNDYGYEYGYYYHYAYANAGSYSSSYGKPGNGIGSYARGVGNSVRRYRDSYLSDRYVRESSAVQSYHDEGVSNDQSQSKLKSGQVDTNVTNNDPFNSVKQSDGSDRSAPKSDNPPTSRGSDWFKKLPFRR